LKIVVPIHLKDLDAETLLKKKEKDREELLEVMSSYKKKKNKTSVNYR